MSKKSKKKDVLGGRVDTQNTVESAPVVTSAKLKKDSPLAGYEWQPGQSGNPAGRPKTSDLKAEVRAFADEADPKIRKTRLRVWLEMADRRARQGSPKHLEMLLAYGWGKPPQSIEMDATFNYTDALTRMKDARRRLEENRAGLPATAPTNGHTDAQMALLASRLPDQDLSTAREDDAEQLAAAPAKQKITVEL